MSLCSLCRSIPFGSLPQLPSHWKDLQSCVNADLDMPYFLYREPSTPNEPLGFCHHSSLETLGASASNCELCGLIHSSVSRFVTSYHKAEGDPVFSYYEDKSGLGFPSNFQLWLTERFNGGDGFFVFVRGVSERSIFLVATVGFCVEDDSALASLYQGRPVKENAGSAITLDRAAAWVQNCVKNHEHSKASGSVPLPSRVLDLECCTNRTEIRLQQTGGLHGTYAALSHCWGQTGHFTTSRASIAARREGIKIEELPQTFQDAVEIVRRVGVRYLWIDSLCICQDDLEDWARESADMAAVYSNAHLTIAAAHARDSSAGCFNQRPERRHILIDVTGQDGTTRQLLAFLLSPGKEALSRSYLEMKDEPLTKRAWALQERLMGPRILHYCTDQMYYECKQEFLSEDGFREPRRYCDLFEPAASAVVCRQSQHSADHGLWYYLLWAYGTRRLSEPSDKLPAMSGLARMFESRIQASYVAGLWSNALVEGLAWQGLLSTKDPATPTSQAYIAPSWSWASFDGIAAAGTGKDWSDIATVLDYHVELKTSNPYGELKGGWIRIRAPLVPVSLSDEPEEDENKVPHKRYVRLKRARGNPFGHYAVFDNIESHNDETARGFIQNLKLSALVLRRHDPTDEQKGVKKEEKEDGQEGEEGEEDKEAGNNSDFFYMALIVVATSNDSGRMRRIGWTFLDPEISEGRTVLDELSEFQTVVLV